MPSFLAQVPVMIPKEVFEGGTVLFALYLLVLAIRTLANLINSSRVQVEVGGQTSQQILAAQTQRDQQIFAMQAQRDKQWDKMIEIVEKQDQRIEKMDVRSEAADKKIADSNEALTKAVTTLRGVIQISEGRLNLADERITALGQRADESETKIDTVREEVVERLGSNDTRYEEIKLTLLTINQRVGKIEENLKTNHDLPPGTKALLQEVATKLEIVSKKTGEIKVPDDIADTLDNTPQQDADKPSEDNPIAA